MLFFRYEIPPPPPPLDLQNLLKTFWLTPRYSFFKTLVDHEVTVELKNDISIRGTLKSVDQFLNIKLENISVLNELKYPHLVCVFRGPQRRGKVRAISGA